LIKDEELANDEFEIQRVAENCDPDFGKYLKKGESVKKRICGIKRKLNSISSYKSD
jgi:hypothetical protein